jgi:hypothetical protein
MMPYVQKSCGLFACKNQLAGGVNLNVVVLTVVIW